MERIFHYIKIRGQDDEGPWIIARVNEGIVSEERPAQRFGVLANHVRELIKGQKEIYGVNYEGPHGIKRIFEEPEEAVIEHIVGTHNNFVDISKKAEYY